MTNIANLFNFISSKKPEYDKPFKFKLIYEPESLTKDELNVRGILDFSNTPITSLPDNLTVGGNLWLSDSPLASLPDNLTVGGYIDLTNTKITSLPNNLKVGDFIDLHHTPLSKQYSAKEIRKMIEDKGGNVKGKIYI